MHIETKCYWESAFITWNILTNEKWDLNLLSMGCPQDIGPWVGFSALDIII